MDHMMTYCGKLLFLKIYLDKLHNIVNSIVADKTDEYTGKMCKAQQEKQSNVAKKKRTKKQGEKQQVEEELGQKT